MGNVIGKCLSLFLVSLLSVSYILYSKSKTNEFHLELIISSSQILIVTHGDDRLSASLWSKALLSSESLKILLEDQSIFSFYSIPNFLNRIIAGGLSVTNLKSDSLKSLARAFESALDRKLYLIYLPKVRTKMPVSRVFNEARITTIGKQILPALVYITKILPEIKFSDIGEGSVSRYPVNVKAFYRGLNSFSAFTDHISFDHPNAVFWRDSQTYHLAQLDIAGHVVLQTCQWGLWLSCEARAFDEAQPGNPALESQLRSTMNWNKLTTLGARSADRLIEEYPDYTFRADWTFLSLLRKCLSGPLDKNEVGILIRAYGGISDRCLYDYKISAFKRCSEKSGSKVMKAILDDLNFRDKHICKWY